MPANPILIVARSSELADELSAALGQAGHAIRTVATPADAVASMRSEPAHLIVAEGLAVSGAIGSLRTSGIEGVTPILVVAPARDVEARIAFLEAGADDVLDGGFSRSELEGRVMALLIRTGRVRPEPSRTSAGEIVAFFSPKGGVGTTTLAVNTAVLLAGGGTAPPTQGSNGGPPIVPSRVLLIDLDLQFGQVATHLNLTPRYDVGVLAADDQALADPEIGRSYLTTHPSGLTILAAPARPETDFRITLDQLQRILEIVRPSYDHILVDLGSRLDARTLWVLEQSDAHVLVLFPEIAALRAMSLLLAFLADSTPLRAETHLVVNHVFPKELLKTRDVENLLRAKPAAEIPYTEVDMIRSVNEGVPLVVSRPAAPATVAIHRIAHAILGVDAAATAKKPERRRMFGRR